MPTRDEFLADLSVFSDLGSAPAIEEDVATHVRASWTYQGTTRVVQLNAPGTADSTVSVDDGNEVSYREFLSSPIMADLGRLATKITLLRGVMKNRSARSLRSGGNVYPMSWYVDPRLGSGPGAVDAGGSAQDRLSEFVEGNATDSTRLLFVMAEAGQGKSSVLEEFTVRQAERFLRRETDRLALYIDAQGRGLARLDEVIARQLNDLQFLLGYSALVALVREGLIILVIDGFDELIGSRGTFDDAFRSLSAFLEILEGRGSLIAAGRSTYFIQEYEARGRLLSDSLRYSLESTFLKAWTHHDQDRFVDVALETTRLSDAEKEVVRRAFAQFHEDDQVRDLLGRPLFARDVLFILLDGGSKPDDLTSDRLVPYLAGEYLRRETEDKLRTGDQSFLTPSQLEEYYRELAEEMWELETRELDVADAESIIDTYAEASWGLTGQAREVARARAGKLPFLVAGDTSRRIQFEHEVFFGYFLAASLVPALRGSSAALSLLGRGRLDAMTADLVVQMTPIQDQQAVLTSLGELAKSRHPRRVQIGANAGALAAALLRRSSGAGRAHGLRLQDLALEGEDLTGVVLRDCTFVRVRFDRVDLRGARFENCHAENISLEGILVDPSTTRLEISGVDVAIEVHGVQFEESSGLLDLTFEPVTVRRILNAVGLVPNEVAGPRFSVSDEVQSRMDQIARAFRHANPIGTNHTRYGVLFTDSIGTQIVRVLVDCGLIDIDAPRQTKGPAQTFYRKRFDEAELMGALQVPTASSGVEDAWEKLSSL